MPEAPEAHYEREKAAFSAKQIAKGAKQQAREAKLRAKAAKVQAKQASYDAKQAKLRARGAKLEAALSKQAVRSGNVREDIELASEGQKRAGFWQRLRHPISGGPSTVPVRQSRRARAHMRRLGYANMQPSEM